MGRAAVRDVATHVIRQEAPEELPLLAGLESVDDAAIDRILARRVRGGGPLAFGLETVVVLVTPVVWSVLSDVAQDGLRAAAQKTAGWVKRRLRWWRKRRGGGPFELPSLDRAGVEELRRLVRDRCTRAGIDDSRAGAIADAVAVRLLLNITDGDAQDETSLA